MFINKYTSHTEDALMHAARNASIVDNISGVESRVVAVSSRSRDFSTL